MKTATRLPARTLTASARARFNPVRTLTPETLGRLLEGFHAGELRATALAWEAIEQRDDVLKAVASKRKKAPGRFGWEIEQLDNSDEAKAHADALDYFYRHLTAAHAVDGNEIGGFSLLTRQMMDAVGKRYAVHEVIWQPQPDGHLTARLAFVPLWFFENRTGRLRFLATEGARDGVELEPGGWLLSTGEGLMEASSIAYLYKHLPLRDWLVYCERNGMPGVRGVTDALPGSAEWEAALEAVRDFGAEFHALMSRGTDIEPIDLSSRSALPYPGLVERMDTALVTLWRGTSMGTFTERGAGVTLQLREAKLIERDDAEHLSGLLQTQLDRWVLRYQFGHDTVPKARINVRHREAGLREEHVEDVREIIAEALPQAVATFVKQFLPNA